MEQIVRQQLAQLKNNLIVLRKFTITHRLAMCLTAM